MRGQYYNGSSRNRVGGSGLVSSGTGEGPVAGCCEHGNGTLDSIKGEFPD
jgi:hypothetical protein